jgi:ankyrin repeat protein
MKYEYEPTNPAFFLISERRERRLLAISQRATAKVMPSTTASSHPVLSVVTNPFMLQRIVAFQRGLPRDLIELARRHSSLAQYAIGAADLPFLQRLFRYFTEQPEYCCLQEATNFRGVWLYAIRENQLEIARWIGEQPSLRCTAMLRTIWSAIIRSQNVDMLKYATSHHPDLLPSLDAFNITEIAKYGALDILKWIEANTGSRRISYAYLAAEAAAKHGHFAMIRHLHEKIGMEWTANTMDLAANSGHLDIVMYLNDKRPGRCTTNAIDWASREGHLDVVRFLHERTAEGCTHKAMNKAAKNGHLAVVQFLHEQRNEGCTSKAMDKAALNGHLAIVQYLHEHRSEGCTIAAVEGAARNGHLDIVKYLHEKNCIAQWSTDVFDEAAAGGHLRVVQFLHECRSEGCSKRAMDQAAANGHLEVVQYLHEYRNEGCTQAAVDMAAKFGRLDMVKFLHENRTEGCTAAAVDQAAQQRHRDVVQYLMDEHSGPYTGAALEAAIKHDWMDVAQLLIAKDPLICTPGALRLAAERGHFEFTQQLFELAPSVLAWTATNAARNGHIQIVKYILERTPNCRHEHVIVGAASEGSVETVQFLHENYHRYCTTAALYEAARHGHLDVLRYLFANCCVSAPQLLVRAAYSGRLDVVRFVLEKSPDQCLDEARAVAIKREYHYIVEFLTNAIDHQTVG